MMEASANVTSIRLYKFMFSLKKLLINFVSFLRNFGYIVS